MRDSLRTQCEFFAHNRDEIKSYYKWENQFIIAICASELCSKGVKVEAEDLLECKNILDTYTGVFSTFRGKAKLPIISMLAAEETPAIKMKNTIEMFDLLKLRFRDSDYLPLSAFKLTEMVSLDEADEYINRGKEIYNLMKKEHPFLTSQEDSVFAVMLAFSKKDNEALVADMEKCYKELKKFSSDSNAMQSLSHVLALCDDVEEKSARVIAYHEALASKGLKYSKGFEMAVLGSLAVAGLDMDTVISEIEEVDEFLSGLKGYGGLGIDKKSRLMHATMLVLNDYSKNKVGNTAALTGTITMIAAQNAAMCAIIASTVAVNTSHS